MTLLYLASQSPRRQALLQQIGVEFEIVSSEINEHQRPQELPLEFVKRMALEKAQAGLAALTQFNLPQRPLLAADTIVVLDKQILGKPSNEAHARTMLMQLAERTHQVMTAICLAVEDEFYEACSISEVTFKALSSQEIEAYLANGEGQDKAGGYAIQGYAAQFIQHLAGSYSGVMGLPLYETAVLLKQIKMPSVPTLSVTDSGRASQGSTAIK